MDNVKKIRKIAISDDIQQKALILAAKYNLQDMTNKKVDIDDILSKIIESSIDKLFENYTNEVKGVKQIQLEGELLLEVLKDDGNATISISQYSNRKLSPLLDVNSTIIQDNNEMGIQVQFNASQIFINK